MDFVFEYNITMHKKNLSLIHVQRHSLHKQRDNLCLKDWNFMYPSNEFYTWRMFT
jgi:hypothetical protein